MTMTPNPTVPRFSVDANGAPLPDDPEARFTLAALQFQAGLAISAAIEDHAIVGTYPNGRPKHASVYAGAPAPSPRPPRRFKSRRRISR